MDLTGIGSVADFASGLLDKFLPTPATAEQKLAVQEAVIARDASRDTAAKDIMVAEMNQSDNYTKRARPTIVYAGLGIIALNYVLFPQAAYWMQIFGNSQIEIPTIEMPQAFWTAWGGVCAIYSLGRSAEKGSSGGIIGKVAGLITGNNK